MRQSVGCQMIDTSYEEVLKEFGHPVLDSHTTLERELAEEIVRLREERDVLKYKLDTWLNEILERNDYGIP